jgi:general secretion pathway protein C
MPRQIHILINLLALFIITYIVVDTFYSVIGMQMHKIGGEKVHVLKEVETRAAKSSARPEFSMIVDRNIFGATEKVEAPPVVEEKTEPIENLEETTLQLSLLGTIAGDTENARAIILDERKRSQDLYRVGDSVQEAEIKQIFRGKVVLRHNGKDEILSMAESSDTSGIENNNIPTPSARATSRTRRISRARSRTRPVPAPEAIDEGSDMPQEIEEEVIPIQQDELQSSINNLNELLTQVRVRPYFRQGKPEGLIVSQIQGDSIFAKLGLMNGDIIASVNGQQMSTPEEAFQLYNSLKSGSPVSIEITRRGQKKMLTYEIQ